MTTTTDPVTDITAESLIAVMDAAFAAEAAQSDLTLTMRLAGLITLDEEAERMAAAHAARRAQVDAANAKLAQVLRRAAGQA